MAFKIGNVVLDDTLYPGQDFYSDGDIEDKLLEIVSTHDENEFNQVIADEKDWAILYHLSDIRQNIVSWLPIGKNETVLEIGSGMGAMTGALADMAEKVTCIELSKRRSTINATRNQKHGNIEIKLGNYQEVEKQLDEKFDWITLIGVFEYGKAYIDSKEPYQEFLRTVKRHLKPNGKLVIAIENKFGMKYFAGYTEDHNGILYDGIENYPSNQGTARTFSKKEITALLEEVGMTADEFYYPYPDYKLPFSIYSDDYLPRKGDLKIRQNFDRLRLETFDENTVLEELVDEGLFAEFANSFLIVAGGGAENE
jgi:2-polyprenyl-3-methyl-5-hydroxy-6-metoxy-1,4-benzoquinol methylase